MYNSKKFACFSLILAAMMASLVVPVCSSSSDSIAQSRTLQFLSDVVKLDLTKCDVTLQSDTIINVSDYGGTQRETVRYLVQTNDSYLDATCFFTKGIYDFCLLDWRAGSPVYSQPQPTNPVDFAKAVLERFQVFIGSPRFQSSCDMLDLIIQTGQTMVVNGNYRLKMTESNPQLTAFQWLYNANGAEAPALEISIQNGTLRGIHDAMNLFSISDKPAVVSEQQSIDIAFENMADFSWWANGQEYRVTEMIPRDHVRAQQILNTMPPRDSLTLFPLWSVTLWLGKTYGGADHINVGVWADTGEVSYIQAAGSGGGNSTPDISDEHSSIPIVAASIAIVSIASIAVFLKKKRK